MSFVTQEYAVNLMRTQDAKFWKIRSSDGRGVLNEQTSEDVTLDQSINQLESALSEIEGKYVIVDLSSKSGRQKGAGGNVSSGNFQLKVKLEGSVSGIGATEERSFSGGAQYDKLNQKIRELELKIVEDKHSREIAELKRENAELKEGNPYMDQIIAGLGNLFAGGKAMAPANVSAHSEAAPSSPALAGPEAKVVHKPGSLKHSLARIAKVDSDLTGTLKALADFASNNPDQYHTYVNMLKQM